MGCGAGCEVGCGVGSVVGAAVGGAVGDTVGGTVGAAVGNAVGAAVVGAAVGAAVGGAVGDAVGGAVVGVAVGADVGDAVGDAVGAAVVGAAVGDAVGAAVGGLGSLFERMMTGRGGGRFVNCLPASVKCTFQLETTLFESDFLCTSTKRTLQFYAFFDSQCGLNRFRSRKYTFQLKMRCKSKNVCSTFQYQAQNQ